ncbi:unnamed protein product, partial [Dicrocoelium dendriticum]
LRAIHAVSSLRVNRKLTKSAQKHAECMAADNELHLIPDVEAGQSIAKQQATLPFHVSGATIARCWYSRSENYNYNTDCITVA